VADVRPVAQHHPFSKVPARRGEPAPIAAWKSNADPAATLGQDLMMATLNAPVTEPVQYSSQPMDGGLAKTRPSMSQAAGVKRRSSAPAGGNGAEMEVLASCGSAVMLPVPPEGSGVVQQ